MENIETRDLINITDDLDIEIFATKNEEDETKYNVVVRVFKKDVYDGVGLTLDLILSKNILDSIDFNNREKNND